MLMDDEDSGTKPDDPRIEVDLRYVRMAEHRAWMMAYYEDLQNDEIDVAVV
jgi:hypothetical protein